MQKIIFITSSAVEKEQVTSNRLLPFIEVGIKNNYLVELISTDNPDFSLVNHNQFIHSFVKPFKTKYTSFVKRAKKEWLLAKKVINTTKYAEAKWVVITIPSMFLLFVSNNIPANKLILDVRDLTWEYLSDAKRFTKSAKLFFRFIAKKQLKRASLILVTNPSEYDFLTKKYDIPQEKIIHVSNGIRKEQFEKLRDVQPKNDDSKKSLVITYMGNVGLAQNLSILIQSASLLPNVKFRIVGDGVEMERIRELIGSLNLNNVELMGKVQWHEVPNIYSQTDVLYAQLSKEYSVAVPSKLYEYLATGKYVVYGGVGEAVEFLSNFSHNSVIEPDSCESLVEVIKSLSNDINSVSQISSENIKQISDRYIRENNVEAFFDIISQK